MAGIALMLGGAAPEQPSVMGQSPLAAGAVASAKSSLRFSHEPVVAVALDEREIAPLPQAGEVDVNPAAVSL